MVLGPASFWVVGQHGALEVNRSVTRTVGKNPFRVAVFLFVTARCYKVLGLRPCGVCWAAHAPWMTEVGM